MEVKVEKPSDDKLKAMGVFSWPIWEKEISKFPWTYNSTEVCYLLEGKVRVTDDAGNSVEFGKGDLVTFPKGLSCTWEVLEAVRKHYNFE